MDDPAIAKAARITVLRDQWLISKNKITPALKARMKKVKEAEKKEKAKDEKKREKSKSQLNEVRRLALSNLQIDSFKEVLSDPSTGLASDISEQLPSVHQTSAITKSMDAMQSNKLQRQLKKRAAANQQASTLRKYRLQKQLNARGESNSSARMPQSLTLPSM